MNNKAKRRTRKRIVIGPATGSAADLKPGERLLVDISGRSVGVFNVKGNYYALHNRCPHMGGKLCEGPVTGTALPADGYEFVYGREGEILRCGWHGWEFDIASGVCLVDAKIRARSYPVTIENDELVLYV